MKYLQRYLIYAGLCLLLVCSANVASAQSEQLVVSLESGSTTQNLVSRKIDFSVNLSRELTGSEALGIQIVFENVSSNEGSVRLLTDYTFSNPNLCPAGSFRRFSTDPIIHILCIDADEQDVAMRLEFNNSFNTRKTITISIFLAVGQTTITNAEGAELDPNNSVLSFTVTPPPTIFIRTKVFLEGSLQ